MEKKWEQAHFKITHMQTRWTVLNHLTSVLAKFHFFWLLWTWTTVTLQHLYPSLLHCLSSSPCLPFAQFPTAGWQSHTVNFDWLVGLCANLTDLSSIALFKRNFLTCSVRPREDPLAQCTTFSHQRCPQPWRPLQYLAAQYLVAH